MKTYSYAVTPMSLHLVRKRHLGMEPGSPTKADLVSWKANDGSSDTVPRKAEKGLSLRAGD